MENFVNHKNWKIKSGISATERQAIIEEDKGHKPDKWEREANFLEEEKSNLPSGKNRKGTWVFRNKVYIFTYRFHLDKEVIVKWIETKLGPIYEAFVGWEKADKSDPYNHTHIYIEFRDSLSIQYEGCDRLCDIGWNEEYRMADGKIAPRDFARVSMEEKTYGFPISNEYGQQIWDWRVHGNYQPIKTTVHKRRALRYVGKEDLECRKEILKSHPNLEEEFDNVVELMEDCKNEVDVLKKIPVNKAGWVSGMLQGWKVLGATRPCNVKPPELKEEWQHDFVDKKLGDPLICNGRSVVVVMERPGGGGKSTLCKWLMVNYPEDWLIIKNFGGSKDFATILKTHKEKGWKGTGIVADLPRAAEHKFIYEPIECYKDNIITSSKWNGESFWISEDGNVNGNKIILFTNWWPNLSQMSQDRWVLFELVKNKEGIRELVKRNYFDVIREQKNEGFIEPPIELREIRKETKIHNPLSMCIGFGPETV